MLNLSDNVMLKGEVPTSGVFSNISAVFVTGNNRLCGGIAKLKLPRCNFVKSKTRRSSHRLRLILPILLGVLGAIFLVLSVSIYICCYRKKTKELATSDDLEDFPNMSYQFLLKATEGFSSNNLLGYGSFGVVYKGILNDQDGKIVAVKVFKLEHAGAFKSFMAECEVLRSMRHRNLIKIVTACSSVDYQGNDFKALVYEYMINGSLDDWLHPTQATNRIQDANHTPKSLNLCQRLDVAVDVAFALEYLHHSCVPSVVHCDLKPSNVLLDSDLVAHVSDFGLAKFLVLEDIDNSQQSSSVGLRGTIGYAPPEYGSGNEVSICGDVYSFGILLLEMFTGKRPTDDMFNDGLSLRHFVEAALPDKVSEILDNALLEEIAVEENNSTMILNALISVLRTALSCSTELPRERLNMSDVATKLSSIKGKLLQRRKSSLKSMNPLVSRFVLCIVMFGILLCHLGSAIARNNESDRLALLEIKAEINDPVGVMRSWNDTIHFCNWYGISCGRRHQRVMVLDLQSLKLTGILSPSIGNLSFLRVLNLQSNTLSGTIPSEIGRLRRLQYLLLGNNSIAGEIPSNISSCSSLIQLDIFNNRLVGRLPPELGFLTQLQYIDLSMNNLTGTIPSSFGNLSSLVELYAARNNLVGRIPVSLGKLTNISVLALGVNKLSETVPSSIFNLSSMTILDLGENDLEGILPSNIGITLPQLQALSLGKNRFTGPIPASISNSTNLEYLQLPSNSLLGTVPSLHNLGKLTRVNIGNNFLGLGQAEDLNFMSSLINATMLQVFVISKNNFAGKFPRAICNFTKLSFLGFQLNNIAGQIPNCIENLADLQYIGAFRNQLSGVIPKEIGKLQSIVELDLTENHLSGYIPSAIGNLTKLNVLQLAQNNLEGQIPLGLGNCRNLIGLDLSQNNLNGSIPSQIFSLSSLSTGLFLSYNHLTGVLPEEVGKLINLENFDVAENRLKGELPSSFSACILLDSLHLEGNFFQGAIPQTLETLKGLHELDMSRNNLSGQVPEFLVSLPLQVLNLSFNNLEGRVPTGGVFNNKSGVSVSGNTGLCGGIPKLKLPKCNFKNIQEGRRSHRFRLIIAIVSGIFGIIFLVGFVFGFVFCYRRKEPKASHDSESSFPEFSYQTLLKATNGFSSENIIGSGISGVVYKGVLDHEGSEITVAVKVFNLVNHGVSKSFMAECCILPNIRHRNLVKVMTVCSSIDYQGNDFKALVYEYMVNGSLDDWLYPVEAISRAQDTNVGLRKLNLHQRLDIAIDVAFALEYLHHRYGTPIVHCDLKPSNVLLDEEMVAHVGDFGLAKFLSKDISNSFVSEFSSFGIRGTIGYTPPEYGMGNELSTYGDVYSFGILLLEIFIGRRPTSDTFNRGLSLHHYVKEALSGRVTDILDHALLVDIVSEENTNTMTLEALISLLEIALSCSAELPQERMNMSDVAGKLSSIRKSLHGTHLLGQSRDSSG
ncbi:putative receptor-like protein kinase At3g47110 [Chenopodium quinoa]|uniref:putative receptor-like protein kinase At3g47110 n=1 Tax=Chenopodium quinoa TaxID=63459 RepID=UPI000B79366D|nr:putative receptor-like protein kinase At3g47110 [Chenopodium quinoa]